MSTQNMFPSTGPDAAPAPAPGQEAAETPDKTPVEGTQDDAQDGDATDPKQDDPKQDDTDWKSRSRDWERKAKANKAAADELATLKEQQMTAEQRAAERERKAEERIQEAEARAARREIALDYSLDKQDAVLLDDMTDEDAMRRLAKRLQAAAKAEQSEDGVDSTLVRRKQRTDPPMSKDAQARKVARSVFSGQGQ